MVRVIQQIDYENMSEPKQNIFLQNKLQNLHLDSINTVLNKISINPQTVKSFAEGGIGILYLIEDFQGKKALLKIPAYNKRPSEEHWLLKHDLKKEAEILSYANIHILPKLFAYDPNGEFLIRSFVEGETLSAYENKSINIEVRKQLLFALINTARILFNAIHEHEKGNFVIRDFKPVNLIYSFSNPDYFHLIDVGSLRSESDMISKTSRSYRIGTGKWLYWSPEQLLEDKKLLDRRSDYFSFGATAFFILTGNAPYSNSVSERNRVMTTYQKEYEKVQRKLDELSNDDGLFPSSMMQMISECLNPNPNYRKLNFY